jgi:hypothetical protein
MARTLRHIAPIILLASYLLGVIPTSLHVHHDTVDAHDDCRQCFGHFEKHHHHQSDCPYCHFLGQDYFGQAWGQASLLFPTADRYPITTEEKAAETCHGVAMLRAPPMA